MGTTPGVSFKVRPQALCKEKGPGPAAYRLPGTTGLEGHDPTRHRAPGYTMASRSGARGYETVGPGPAHAVPQGMTKNGPAPHIGVPMAGPWTNLRTMSVPGPGAHRPEDCPTLGPRPPAYSLRIRFPPRRQKVPAPAPIDYALPSCLGHHVPDKHASPAYTMCHVPRAPKYAPTLGQAAARGTWCRRARRACRARGGLQTKY